MNLPEDVGSIIAKLEKRIADLETSPRAANTSVRGGAIRILDSSSRKVASFDGGGVEVFDPITGNKTVDLGILDNGKSGIVVYGNGTTMGSAPLNVDTDGMKTPYLASPYFDPSASKPITSATFVTVYESRVDQLTHGGVFTWWDASGDAATTGEVRLTTGAFSTSAVTIPAGAFVGLTQFKWLHGFTLGAGPISFKLEARRTGGGGNVNVFARSALVLAHPGYCTTTGL